MPAHALAIFIMRLLAKFHNPSDILRMCKFHRAYMSNSQRMHPKSMHIMPVSKIKDKFQSRPSGHLSVEANMSTQRPWLII